MEWVLIGILIGWNIAAAQSLRILQEKVKAENDRRRLFEEVSSDLFKIHTQHLKEINTALGIQPGVTRFPDIHLN